MKEQPGDQMPSLQRILLSRGGSTQQAPGRNRWRRAPFSTFTTVTVTVVPGVSLLNGALLQKEASAHSRGLNCEGAPGGM